MGNILDWLDVHPTVAALIIVLTLVGLGALIVWIVITDDYIEDEEDDKPFDRGNW